MLIEYAHFCLVIALGLACVLAVLPMLGSVRGWQGMHHTARSLALGQCVFLLAAFAGLVYAFLSDDFTVATVANYSNSLLPTHYKFSAVWGNHEGSILLWALILGLWTVAVALFSRELPEVIVARTLSVLGMISVGVLLFSLFTSNPFARTFPNIPADGADLNPLLQDFGLIVHPPILYVGYVGFSVAFAFAIAALTTGQLDAAWARWSRPWTNIAWAFLTLGIALGSWWAYYELGWGGWWFWDPVENASFMPWLVGTALVHSLAVTEQRGAFKSWTVLLAITAFSLSLLGTFLVRSGVLTSVHAFASDPERGVFILLFLTLVVVASLTLFALRVPAVRTNIQFTIWSREFFLLLNNIIFVLAMLVVLLGTLYPLFVDAMGMGRYSVGPPYFNALFVPLMAVLFALLGLGPHLRWRQTKGRLLARGLLAALLASLLLGLVFPLSLTGELNLAVSVAVVLASWVFLSSFLQLGKLLARDGDGSLRALRASHIGMLLAHTGAAVTLLGVALTSHYSTEHDLRLSPGESAPAGPYQVQFVRHGESRGPNYFASYGEFQVLDGERVVADLRPEKRRYFSGQNIMTEAAIRPSLPGDVYLALGDKLAGDAWAVRVHYKAFVRFLWLGAILMAAGALTACFDKRYRVRALRKLKPVVQGQVAASQVSG